jgi:hypothetical protein
MKHNEYLWNAQQTDFAVQAPHRGAWEDAGEWRLISYIALDAGGANGNLKTEKLQERIRKTFGPLNVESASCRNDGTEIMLLYGCPYGPLLQRVLRRKGEFAECFDGRTRGAGQLLVSLPPSAIPYFFWKHDVLDFKKAEKSAARKICHWLGCKYDSMDVPWGERSEALRLKGGPSWRWWTRYLNEDVPPTPSE